MSVAYAVTVWQPHATLIMLGAKQHETRHWPAPRRIIGERIAIHAGKATTTLELAEDEPFRRVLGGRELPMGALLGTVVVAASIVMDPAFIDGLSDQERAFGHFAPGRHAWRLEEPHLLYQPRPWKGAQGVWSLEAGVVALSPVAPGQGTLL